MRRMIRAMWGADPNLSSRVRRRRPLPRFAKPVALLVSFGAGAVGLSAAAGWASQTVQLEDRIAALKGAAIGASTHIGLTLQEIIVTGRRESGRGELLTAVGLKRGETILTFDVDEARARIEALTWVKSAEVERAFPDAIRISITEREPIAIWQNGGRLQLIDTEGRVIRARDLRRFRSLPVVVGPDAADHAAALLGVVAAYPELAKRVTAAVRVSGRRWNLRLDDRLIVRLPEENPAAALLRLAALQREHRLLDRDIVAIDLRLPERLVVQLAPGAEERMKSPERPILRSDVRETGRT